MTNTQIAESLVNKTRNYRASDVVDLIVEGIRQSQMRSLEKQRDAATAALVAGRTGELESEAG